MPRAGDGSGERARPASVQVERDRRLTVRWADGHHSRFPVEDLRRDCLCAACRELRERGEVVWPRPGAPERLEVVEAEFVGNWGLGLRWNDGHDTGVYPWDVLRAWG